MWFLQFVSCEFSIHFLHFYYYTFDFQELLSAECYFLNTNLFLFCRWNIFPHLSKDMVILFSSPSIVFGVSVFKTLMFSCLCLPYYIVSSYVYCPFILRIEHLTAYSNTCDHIWRLGPFAFAEGNLSGLLVKTTAAIWLILILLADLIASWRGIHTLLRMCKSDSPNPAC